jgi:APA family basic amino acid/polyamine antiporter
MDKHSTQPSPELRRDIGVFGAMMMGMGSIVGTGVFVSIGIAAEVAGPSVIVAIFLGSLVAICNGLSSAQLAANHPVSGGTYEYGYRWLNPRLGFVAGWMFLCAKSASAATAALGFAGYLVYALGGNLASWQLPIALVALILLTITTLVGIRRSSAANIAIVSITLASLIFFVCAGFPLALSNASTHFRGVISDGTDGVYGLLRATALMFVAYTGYGRIATLGEEVKHPERTIPRAIIATLVMSMVLYLGVALVGIGAVGSEAFGAATRQQVAPLEIVATRFGVPGAGIILAVGAITAMLGVLLNLLLGLSRVLLAMGRRGDMPQSLAYVSSHTSVPWAATLTIAAIIGTIVLLRDVRVTWSFSAFTVLIYYALTNLCAIRLQPEQRLFPIWPAYCGLVACLFLAFWVEWQIWLIGLGLILVGLVWQALFQRRVGQ